MNTVVFRTDASIRIGSGHVMRCLTLADEMKKYDVKSHFICRDFPGQMADLIRQHDHTIMLLPKPRNEYKPIQDDPDHAHLLGVPWMQDADETIRGIDGNNADWLIIDHYGIDHRWQRKLRTHSSYMMVIDDLADRKLDCDLVLDQTYGRREGAFLKRIPEHCQLLLGTQYALLRPEFAGLRSYALEKRKRFKGVKHILISMGGTDPDNLTGFALTCLAQVPWKERPVVDLVLGSRFPHLKMVTNQAPDYPLQINILIDATNMAELMIEADIAIGSGGISSWERCCMALPSILVVAEANQEEIGKQLHNTGAAISIKYGDRMKHAIIESLEAFIWDSSFYNKMSLAAAKLCDGSGAPKVAKKLMEL